jgi:hypothetical protein
VFELMLRVTKRCGHTRSDMGSITAETAVALPSLALVLGAALWGVAAVTAQLECVDAARSGARAAARGEPLEVVRKVAGRAAPAGAAVSVVRDSDLARVTVSTSVRPTWVIGVPPIPVGASAVSASEPGVGNSSGSGVEVLTPGLQDFPSPRRSLGSASRS